MSDQAIRVEVATSAVVHRANGTVEDLGVLSAPDTQERELTQADIEAILADPAHPFHEPIRDFLSGLTEGH